MTDDIINCQLMTDVMPQSIVASFVTDMIDKRVDDGHVTVDCKMTPRELSKVGVSDLDDRWIAG